MTENNDTTQLNDEEDIIELTDVVSDTENIDDIELTDSMDKKVGISEEEEMLELNDDILDDVIKLEDDLNKDIEIDNYLDDEFVDSTDSDSAPDVSKDLLLEPQEEEDELKQLIADVVEDSQQETAYEEVPATDTPESELIPLSSEQVDKALERVIKKMYADKIDSMLTEVIEKTVTKEIEE
ncbi:MAG: hypothetical protein LWW98_06240, partial [Deltaproteobacteria bacterium]|nr:hypothetical protein [Deltaproteobacteria bacterium]